ncbi:MAG: hypothetical protein PHI12_13335 [Dehalococcoidales bacterium]|nr:hypothetical protein [Dehalococcoidales bacterium]
MAAIGRKKARSMTRLAILVECADEYCGGCSMLEVRRDEKTHCHFLWCKFFNHELSPSYNDNVAERCAACHLAERCAKGEKL